MYSASSVVRGTDQTSEAEKVLQRQKFDEILGVLLSAGYFRARIATLTPFDKVRPRVTLPRAAPSPAARLLHAGGWWHVLVSDQHRCGGGRGHLLQRKPELGTKDVRAATPIAVPVVLHSVHTMDLFVMPQSTV